jgi:hypothetical protein
MWKLRDGLVCGEQNDVNESVNESRTSEQSDEDEIDDEDGVKKKKKEQEKKCAGLETTAVIHCYVREDEESECGDGGDDEDEDAVNENDLESCVLGRWWGHAPLPPPLHLLPSHRFSHVFCCSAQQMKTRMWMTRRQIMTMMARQIMKTKMVQTRRETQRWIAVSLNGMQRKSTRLCEMAVGGQGEVKANQAAERPPHGPTVRANVARGHPPRATSVRVLHEVQRGGVVGKTHESAVYSSTVNDT